MRKPRLHLRNNLLLRVLIVAAARQLHQKIQPPCAVLVGRIRQCSSLCHSQPLHLQLACGLVHSKRVACRGIQCRFALQNLKLLRRLFVPARVVVRIRQAAQLGQGQRCLCSRCGQLGPRRLRFRAQGILQQHPLKGRFRRLLLAQCLLHFAFSQLKCRAVRSRRLRTRRQNLSRGRQLVHPQQHVGLKLRGLNVKNALGIAVGKSVQNILGSGIVARCMARLGVQKVDIVRELSVGAASFGQRGFGLGVALIEQIRVAERKVSRRSGLACVAMRVGRHSGIGRRRAQRRQLLGHRLKLF